MMDSIRTEAEEKGLIASLINPIKSEDSNYMYMKLAEALLEQENVNYSISQF
jgi:hypothetical protein